MHILRSIFCAALIVQASLPGIFNDMLADRIEIAYPARYNFISFWLAQGTKPLVECVVEHKETVDKLMVPIRCIHRSVDLVAVQLLLNARINDPLFTGLRAVNIGVEEISLYGLKSYIGPEIYIFADEKIKIRKVAAIRIVHKGVFKTLDKALETKGNVTKSVQSGVRASVAEAAYISVTQLVHNIVPVEAKPYINQLLPDNAYPRTFWQHMTKLAVTSVANALATYVV